MKHTKFLALFLSVLILVTAIPVVASAGTYGVLTYSKSYDEITITGCNKSAEGDIVIPEAIDGYPVTRIGENAFESCKFITSVTIPDSVKYIWRRAFTGCEAPKVLQKSTKRYLLVVQHFPESLFPTALQK